MAAKLTRLTHKTAIQLHLVAECCTIGSSHSRRPVRKLLNTLLWSSSWYRGAASTWLPVSPITYTSLRSNEDRSCHFSPSPCYVGRYHHSMAHPWVAGGGDGLQICTVATNLLNKQLQTADKEWSSSLRLGDGLTTTRRKETACYKCYTGPWNWKALENMIMILRVP
jgi:hypothetical protein